MTKERGSQSCGEKSRNVRLTCVVPRGSERKCTREAEQEPDSLKIHTSTDPYGRSLLDPPKSGILSVSRLELEEHLTQTYCDAVRGVPLQERLDIPAVPLPTSSFDMTAPSLEEVRGIVKKSRNKSAPEAKGIPYLVYKKCPKAMTCLHVFIEKAWLTGTVSGEWKQA